MACGAILYRVCLAVGRGEIDVSRTYHPFQASIRGLPKHTLTLRPLPVRSCKLFFLTCAQANVTASSAEFCDAIRLRRSFLEFIGGSKPLPNSASETGAFSASASRLERYPHICSRCPEKRLSTPILFANWGINASADLTAHLVQP